MTYQEHCSYSPRRSTSLPTPMIKPVLEPNKVLKMIKAKCLQLVFFESSGKHLSQAPLKPGRNICLVQQPPPSKDRNHIGKAVTDNGLFWRIRLTFFNNFPAVLWNLSEYTLVLFWHDDWSWACTGQMVLCTSEGERATRVQLKTWGDAFRFKTDEFSYVNKRKLQCGRRESS